MPLPLRLDVALGRAGASPRGTPAPASLGLSAAFLRAPPEPRGLPPHRPPCLQMRSSPKDSRMAPSVHAYTAAMRAASEGGRWEAALSIWDDMQAAGCKPTGAHTHRARRGHATVRVQRCERAPSPRLAAAAAAADRARPPPFAAAQPPALPCPAPCPCSPHLPGPMPPYPRRRAGHAYAAVISACAAGGQWQKAVGLFDDMLAWGVRPDVVSCTALITGAGGSPAGQPCWGAMLRHAAGKAAGGCPAAAYTVSFTWLSFTRSVFPGRLPAGLFRLAD